MHKTAYINQWQSVNRVGAYYIHSSKYFATPLQYCTQCNLFP